MSIQAITAAFALEGVGPSEKLLLLALANYADEHGRSYPSQKRLATDTGMNERTIRRLLSELAADGLLTRTERLRSDGSRSTDIITLTFPAQIAGGAGVTPGGVRAPEPGGAGVVSALTTFEPSINPERSEDLSRGVRKRAAVMNDFEAWYDGYPHKIGRGDAEKAFPKARQLASLAELIEGRDHYVLTKPPDRPWCNPATWLNQKRWLDRPAEIQPPTGPHERNRQPPNNRAAGRGVWSEIIAEHDGAPARDLARA